MFEVNNPFSTDASTQKKSVATTTPTVCSALEVGEICVFIIDSKSRMGRVLQFSYYQEKTKKSQQYRGSSIIISESKKKYGSALYMVQTDISSTAICSCAF